MTRSALHAVLFDLDGTLVDSLPDIHGALNALMQEIGRPGFTPDQVRRMIGRGVHVLIERALHAQGMTQDAAQADALAARFVALYAPRATQLTQLRPGAAALVRHLHEAGVAQAVVTNKRGPESRQILAHFGLLERFNPVIGGDAGPALKPDPGLIVLALQQLNVAPQNAAFIGDSENDVLAARAAGVAVAVLEDGYTSEPAEALQADAVLPDLTATEAWLGRRFSWAANPAAPG